MGFEYRFWNRLQKLFSSAVARRQRRNKSTGSINLNLEPLETRRLLSITPPFIHPSNGRLVVEGSEEADQVTVSELTPGTIRVEIASNGENLTTDFVKSQISLLILRGNGGDDVLTNQTDLITNAYGGLGNDTITGGSSTNTIFGDEGDDHIIGGGSNDLLRGGDGADVIYGGAGNDSLVGDAGNDMLYGELGDDLLLGEAGEDLLEGGDGNDTLRGGIGNDLLRGDTGDDRLEGEAGDDYLQGGAGVDTLLGGTGLDRLRGGEGNDYLYGNEDDDILLGDEGDDNLNGGDGNDTLDDRDGNNTLSGGLGNDKLYSGAGADILRGDAGDDLLVAGAGNDLLYGDEGNDVLHGEEGDDQLYGGAGNDVLFAGLGKDVLRAGEGNDELYGEGGNDTLIGEAGDDLLYGGDGDDDLQGSAGNDTLYGGLGNDILRGGEGLDKLSGDEGNDTLHGDAGADVLRGGDGDDTLYGGSDNDSLLGGAGHDTLRGGDGNDNLLGQEGNDTLLGDAGDDSLYGADGDDTLIGGDGHDTLNGSLGNDTLNGGLGNDILRGGEGNDDLQGSEGDDTLYGWTGDDTLRGGAGNDKLIGGDDIDTLQGDEGDDELYGSNGDDLLYGGLGNDILIGGQGADRLYGEQGSDLLKGDEGDDQLYGGDDADNLFGGEGNDILRGDAGDDQLTGDAGNDTLLGGVGNDNLRGNDGDDGLYGEAGADILIADAGADILYGGDDNDFLYGDIGNDQLYGGEGNDTLQGGDGDDIVRGDEGDDLLYGGGGNDTIAAGSGRDVLSGDEGNDVLLGDEGPDLLLGGTGDDQLSGNDGNDILIGEEGIDTLAGHDGEDILIGGKTSHSIAVLDLALAAWNEATSYDVRRMNLEDEFFAARLASEVTLFDDYVPDSVIGGGGQDWFFLPGAMSIYDPTGNSVNSIGHEHHNTQVHSHHSAHVIGHVPVVEGFAFIDSLDELRDMQADEALHTLVPHSATDARQAEHLTLFEVVKYADVTHSAIASGDWSNPSNWSGGVVPGDGARVLVPIGVSLTVDTALSVRLATIRVDGELSFATDVNTQLLVETMVVGTTGELHIGTTEAPMPANVTARLQFIDSGPIDRSVDPFGISRGLISHGTVEMKGAEVSSYTELAGPVVAGATTLNLTSVPVGWKVGDQIVIAGTTLGQRQEEQRTILAIFANTVIVDPLTYDHLTPDPSLKVHVANLTRNIVIDSESSVVSRRGHVMFMHNNDVHIENVGFYRLGRTDKLTPLNDSEVDENWQLVSGTGTNNRARYPVHFHRTGTLLSGTPASVQGSVVVDAPGWGYVNHSSYVEFIGNVSFDVVGAGFVSEVGDEVGLFQENLAIKTIGSGETINSRRLIFDFGHTGDGFWFQGAGIEVVDNISTGADNGAFTVYTEGLREFGVRAVFNAANLLDPSIANGADSVEIDEVPMRKFTGNIGYASPTGLIVRLHLTDAPHSQSSLFEDSTFWNNDAGIRLPYSQQIILRNLNIVRSPADLDTTGVTGNADSKDIVYDNLTISGYYTGINVARRGYSIVNGGSFTTQRAIGVLTASGNNRTVVVQGPITFNSTPFNVPWMYEIDMRFNASAGNEGIAGIFNSSTVTLNYGSYTNRKVYFYEQHPSTIVFPEPADGVPSSYVGLSSLQLLGLTGLPIVGEFAPLNSVTNERINGLLAP